MNVTAPAVVYVVDDEVSVRKALRRLFVAVGYEVEVFASAEEFQRHARGTGPGCLVLDVRMSGMSGLELQRQLRATDPDLPVILISGHGDAADRKEGLEQGAVAFLCKPFDDEALLAALREALG